MLYPVITANNDVVILLGVVKVDEYWKQSSELRGSKW